jgi:integrase
MYAKYPAKTRRKMIRQHLDCDCYLWVNDPKHLVEWHTGTDPRVTTKTRDLKTAQLWLLGLDADTKSVDAYGPKLVDCMTKYCDYRKNETAPGTMTEYRGIFAQLEAFATSKNVVFIQETDANFYKDFKTFGMGPIAETTKKMRFAKVKAFLGEAYDRKWIKEDLARQLRKVRFNLSTVEPTQPYTEDEVRHILEVAGTVNGQSHGYGKDPATFGLLCRLMNETGLRVSDAIAFNPKACTACQKPGRYLYQFYPAKHIRIHKPTLATVYITETLKTAIESCVWMSQALPFSFLPINEETRPKLTGQVYKRLHEVVGPKAGVENCRPHRFRDSFAVRCILVGFGVENVSKLLNHSTVQVTVDYYLPWIKQRQTMLEDSFFDLMA